MTDSTKELANLLIPKSQVTPPNLVMGVVASIEANGRLSVYLEGSDFPIGNIRYFDQYQPRVGDLIYLFKNGPNLIALGTMSSGPVTSATRPNSPYIGQKIFETDTLRELIWDGTYWRYEGNTIIHPEGVVTSAVTTNNGVSGTSPTWTPDFVGKADIYFDAHLDFDTAGATGFVRIQRKVGAGAWTTIADHAYHDMSESEGHAVGGTFPDKGWVPGSSIQYRMVLVISAGSNITLRSDSVFSIYWYGRV